MEHVNHLTELTASDNKGTVYSVKYSAFKPFYLFVCVIFRRSMVFRICGDFLSQILSARRDGV